MADDEKVGLIARISSARSVAHESKERDSHHEEDALGDTPSHRIVPLNAAPYSSTALHRRLRGAAKAGANTPAVAPTGAPSPTSLPTATLPQLAFHPVTLPAGYVQQNFALSISPLEGRVAWACTSVGDGAFRVWLTTDEAAVGPWWPHCSPSRQKPPHAR